MKTRLLKKLRKQAKNRICLQPLYGGRIGIYLLDYDEWYSPGVLDLLPQAFKSLEDALPTLQRLRENYVRNIASRMKLEKKLKKY